MVDAILLKWPHLRNEFRNDSDAKILWKTRLKTHFKNSRRRTPSVPVIRRRKRNHDRGDNNDEPPHKKATFTWGVPNFLPPFPDGENENTMKTHANKLFLESKVSKERRDKTKVARLLKLTFPLRRKMIVEELHKISSLLEQFPILKNEEQLYDEFKLIANFDIVEKMEIGLSKYRDSLIHMRPTSDKKDLLGPIRSEFSSSRNERGRIYIANCLSILTIPFMLRESPLALLDDSESIQPRIRFNRTTEDEKNILIELINADRLSVVVEDQVVVEVSDFVTAFTILVALHYIFNLVYTSNLEGTYTAVQKTILDLSDGIKACPKVINFMTKLKKL